MNISGKNVIITGGTGGIAVAVCRELLRSGASNIGLFDIIDRDNISLKLQQEFPNKSIRFYKTDIRNKENVHNSFQKFITEFNGLDIVIGNAAIYNEHIPDECVQINVLGIINTTYEAINWMSVSKNGKGGVIVNISSIAGLNTFYDFSPVYNCTKHAVIGFTKSMANETNTKLHGINFITICPGGTETPLLLDGLAERVSPDFKESLFNVLPQLDLQTAEQLAKHLVDTVKDNKNGTIMAIENNKRKEYTPVGYVI